MKRSFLIKVSLVIVFMFLIFSAFLIGVRVVQWLTTLMQFNTLHFIIAGSIALLAGVIAWFNIKEKP